MSNFSRRWLLGQGAAALALSPMLARAATSPPAPATQPPVQSSETIEAGADAQQRMTLDVLINGAGPFRFLVDTGADQSVIATEVAASLGLVRGDEVVVQGISRAVPAPTVNLKNVEFGHVEMADLTVPVLPRAWLGADGYLGLDVVDGRKVTFDFLHHRIKLDPSSRAPSWIYSSETIIRANGSNGRLTAVHCSVDGVQAAAFIDSGAEISIGNTHLFNALHERGANYLTEFTVPIFGVTGGQTLGRFTAIDSIRLGPLNFYHSTLVIADLDVFDVWGLSDRPALFIGMNFLRQANELTIDFGRKEFRFKTADNRLASRA